jgi:hypothetical protein
VKLFRNPALLAAVSVTVLLAIYLGLVAQRALMLLNGHSLIERAMGALLFILPAIGAWFLVKEWRLGTAVQQMSSRLEAEGRLPAFAGGASASGRLPDAAAEEAVALASMEVELAPDDWAAWFHVAFAYDAAGERAQARKCLRYAAELFRTARSNGH